MATTQAPAAAQVLVAAEAVQDAAVRDMDMTTKMER